MMKLVEAYERQMKTEMYAHEHCGSGEIDMRVIVGLPKDR
jgi:hypothetical protein